MIEIAKEPERPLLLVKATGVVHADDYAGAMPEFKELAAKIHPKGLLTDWTELEGWDEEAESVRFFVRLEVRSEFERIAVLADDAWIAEISRLRDVTATEIRHFPPSEREAALAWLDSDSER